MGADKRGADSEKSARSPRLGPQRQARKIGGEKPGLPPRASEVSVKPTIAHSPGGCRIWNPAR